MRSNFHKLVPSTALLKFLKSQSEAICFFTPSSRAVAFDHGGLYVSGKHAPRQLVTTTRSLSTTVPSHTTVEAGFLNLDFLLPRVSTIRQQRCPVHSNGAKYGGLRKDTQIRSRHNPSTWTGRWLWRPWGHKKSTTWPLRPDDLPLRPFLDEYVDPSMFSLGRMSAKAMNEPKLRCTEFDENGNVVLVNGEFKKTELIAKYGLLPRDLRKIDSSLLPHILVRPSAILINLLHIRCLVKADRILVFDTYGSTDSYAQSAFIYELEGKLRQKPNSPSAGGLPYEFRALEAVLISVTSGLEAEFDGVREPVVRVLRELEEDIDRHKLRHLLIYSKKLGTFEQKAKLVRDAIDELLEADDDLVAMYLTEKAHNIVRGEDDHTEVEMLLESYHKVCDEIVQASGNLVSNIRNTEEIIKAILDANRNSLMLLDLKFSIGTLGIGSGAFIAALYGMNLKNFIEESDLGFWGISAWSLALTIVVFAYGLVKLRKVQRVSMWGEAGKRPGRGSWRSTDDGAAVSLLEARRREKNERLRRVNDDKRVRVKRESIGSESHRAPVPVAREIKAKN